jgi:hypothetical protein
VHGYHWTVFWIAVAVLSLAGAMVVRSDQRVEFAFAPGRPLPHLCYSRLLLGIDCPGCGLTRSFIHLVHGDVAASFTANRAGWLLFLATLLQVPYRLWAVHHPGGAPLGHRVPVIVLISLLGLLWINWGARLLATWL